LSQEQTQLDKINTSSLFRSVNVQKSSPEITDFELNKFNNFLNIQNIVLLGDPGSGKTHTFKETAENENAKFLTIRSFLATKGKGCNGKVIYLDGLDEVRSRANDKNTILGVIKTLTDVNCESLRLSCRAQDWLGDSDLNLFETYFNDESYAVLNLEPLRQEEILSILISHNIEFPQEFIDKATSLNLSTLLHNPQTLIMLIDVVKQGSGKWPATKKDLYKKSSVLLLTEHNDERARSGSGEYSPNELLNTAGIACATILISGVEGISLRNNGGDKDFPSYRELTICEPELLLATLTRRIFSYSTDETVSCIHRTVAEYLAASWLVDQVTNNNFPIKRVLSLITSEDHPISDLRGLYSWLATLLPDNYNYLFDNDPYGVLMYGDPASLSPSSRQYLLTSLEALKEKDPWFRSGDWSDNPLGALAGKDMESAFKRILVDPSSGFHLRNIVLNSIILGEPNPNLIPVLKSTLENTTYGYSDRSDAVEALLKLGIDGKNSIKDSYDKALLKEPKSIRLRINILSHLYLEYFQTADAIQIIIDRSKQSVYRHLVDDKLYRYHTLFPVSHLREILNEISSLIPSDGSDYAEKWKNSTEIEKCLYEMVVQVLDSDLDVTPETLYFWLNSIRRLKNGMNTSPEDLSKWLGAHQSIVFKMFDTAYKSLNSNPKQTIWWIYNNFRTTTLHMLNQEAFALYIAKKYLSNPLEHLSIYELFASITFNSFETPKDLLLTKFYDITDVGGSEILPLKEKICVSMLDDWKLEEIQNTIRYREKEKNRKLTNQQNIKKTLDSITKGKNLANLEWLAGRYYSHKNGNTGRERLEDYFDSDTNLVDKVIDGFLATLVRSDLPTVNEIAKLEARGGYYPWWYAVLAGMDEHWLRKPEFKGFSNETLSSLLSISISRNTGNSKRVWNKEIIKQFPSLSKQVYETFALKALEKRKDVIPVISTLLNDDFNPPWKEQLAISLLTKYPNTGLQPLENLVSIVLGDDNLHSELLQLTKDTINKNGYVKKEKRLYWLLVGFYLDERYFSSLLVKYSTSRPWVAQQITDFFEERHGSKYDLSISQISLLSKTVGALVPYLENSSPFGRSGFVRDMITKLSSSTEEVATSELRALLANKKLGTYSNHLKHAIAEQSVVRRSAIYQQPDWTSVIETLKDGHPANIADLHALTLEQLNSLKPEILNTNTDIYKNFWNSDSHGKITTPIVEDICRDRLIDLLRPNYKNMHIEPEGHMAQDKRADIVILSTTPNLKLPLELKRDIHKDLWTACKNQLERMYTRDPDAQGYGIYVVFWFGDKRKGKVKQPPTGLNMPTTAQDLEDSLTKLIPENKQHCLSVIVLDVNPH